MDQSPIQGEIWGRSQRGRQWVYSPESGIVTIKIVYEGVIDSINFKEANENNTNRSSEKYGGSGGNRSKQFTINWPYEYLTKITGTTVTFNGDEVVGSLTFYTNRNNKHEFIGSHNVDARPFEFPEQNRAIVGFFGRQNDLINAIGVYHKDPPVAIVITEVIIGTTMIMDIPGQVLGPWGGNRGEVWDDGRLRGRIKQIDVHVGNEVIHGIHYQYEDSNPSPVVLSKKHGGNGATTIYRIQLDNDDNQSSPEKLVGISGFYGDFNGNCCVRSISFYTNKGKYGPIGTENGTSFNSPACTNAKVVGFHGISTGQYLVAIGVHAEY